MMRVRGEVMERAGGDWPARARSRLPRWVRRAVAARGVRQVTLLVCYLAAGLTMTWPRATYGGSQVPGTRDAASYVWGFEWVARQVTHLGNPWFTHAMAAPPGVALGFHTLMPLPGLLLTPVTLAFGPVASYNLMVVVVPGLLAYAMYRAARLWLPAIGAVAAGAFFGYSAMLAQQDWYHVNIAAGAIFLPLALEASVRLRRRTGRRQAIYLGVVMGVAVLTDQESALLAAIVVALALLPWLVRRRSWAALRMTGLAVAAGAVLASPQIVAMIWEQAQGGLGIDPKLLAVSYKQYGIGLPGMFTPTPRVSRYGLEALAQPFLHGRDNEGLPVFGSVLTALALLGIVVAWRRRATWRLAAMWLGCAALALGTSLWIGRHQYLPLGTVWHGVRVSDIMPYTWFVRIPGMSGFREADRLAILGLLPAALLAGAAVEWLRAHAGRWLVVPVLAVVAALGVLEAGYSGGANVELITTASYAAVDRPVAADHSGSIVLDVPFGLRGGIPESGVPFFPRALFMATLDNHPRSIAYISRLPWTTIDAIYAHPFYRYLLSIQHEVPQTCPWRKLGQSGSQLGCQRPPGVVPRGSLPKPAATPPPSARQVAAAGLDARRMRVGWAIMWKRNPSADDFVRPYLVSTGFCFSYRVGNVLVYQAHWLHPACSSR